MCEVPHACSSMKRKVVSHFKSSDVITENLRTRKLVSRFVAFATLIV